MTLRLSAEQQSFGGLSHQARLRDSQIHRAEREADWALHLDTVKDTVPLFFSAGHVHYARYTLYYLRTMEGLPDGVRAQFINGQHFM